MTTLVPGASQTISVGDGGSVSLSSNGGFASVTVTPTVGSGYVDSFGPGPYRRVYGPFSEGGSVQIVNSTAAIDYDSSQSLTTSTSGSAPAAILADSYGSIALTYNSGTLVYYDANNAVVAMSQLLGDAFELVYDGSITGTTSSNWIANPTQLAGVLASAARVVFVGFPNNDPELVNNYAQTVANMTAIFSAIQAAGKQIIVCSSGNKSTWTAAQRAQAYQISTWITQTAKTNAWPLIDVMGGTYDPATGVGSTALYLNESGNFIHPNAPGWLYACAQSVQEFARFPGRVVQKGNSFYQGIYNTAMAGTAPGNGWTNYTSGVPTLTSQTKVSRTDSVGEFLRSTGTSDAANSRYGVTQTINITGAWSTGAKALGARVKGSFGDHWVVTTAGTSSGSEPAAMAAASTVGQTVTDGGGVVWTRYSNIIPGVTPIQIRAEVDITSVSLGDTGAQPVILANFTGSSGIPGVRANNLGSGINAQRWTFTKTLGRRTVIKTPPNVVVPLGTTAIVIFCYQQWSAASTVSSFDLYGLEWLVP